MNWAVVVLEGVGIVAGLVLVVISAYALALAVFGSVTRPTGRGANGAASPPVTALIVALSQTPALDETLRRVDAIDYPDLSIAVGLGSVPTSEFKTLHPLSIFPVAGASSKAETMNECIKRIHSDCVLLLDEDSLVEADCLRKMVPLLGSPDTWAVVGVPYASNADAGILQRTLGLEAEAWTIAARARDGLRLFLPATGFFSLISAKSLAPQGGTVWDQTALAEDTDLSLKRFAAGLETRLSSARVGIEAPGTLTALAKQRLRWYKGMYDALWKNRGIVVRLPFRKAVDAALGLLSPLAPASFVVLLLLSPLWPLSLGPVLLAVAAAYLISAASSALKLKRGRAGVILFSVPYALIQGAVALAALSAFLLHIEVRWQRTPKSADRA